MKLSLLGLLTALVGVVLGAQKEVHGDAYMKSLLRSSSARPGLIRLNDKNFESVVSTPRDYGLVVLITAEAPQMGCQLCRQFAPDFNLIVHSWNVDHPNSDGLYFGILDFRDGQQTFKKLQLKTAPNLWVYAPTVGENAGPNQPFNYEIVGVPDVPASLARYIQSHIPGITIEIHRPKDYSKIVSNIFIVLGAIGALRFAYTYLRPVWESRALWAGLSLVLILMFTSGHMYNNIRHTPYVATARDGQVQYIAGGFSNQYGFETQAIAVLYAFLAFSSISLASKIPRNPIRSRQTIAVGTWCTIMLALFSLLLFVFRMKNRGYPFSLPPMTK